MKYLELKEQRIKEINDFPVFWAFSKEQLEKGLKKINATKKEIVSIGAGGYMRREDTPKFDKLFRDSEKRMQEALKDDAFLIEALVYELGNHEYGYTYDDTDTIEFLGLDRDDEQVKRCLKEAKRIYNERQEVYG